MYRNEELQSDIELVGGCLRGDKNAWEKLYFQCNAGLVYLIRSRLSQRLREDQIEEVASCVWLSLLEQDYALLRQYDPDRGCRLLTYLLKIARKEFRRLRRTGARQSSLENAEHFHNDVCTANEFVIDDFLEVLSPRERQFCTDHLLTKESETSLTLSQPNIWQLRHRVMKKARIFIDAV
jgi:DNA-directed RNA polymerase specialized sigma24 family protein